MGRAYIFFMVIASAGQLSAQTISTKEAKILLIVDSKGQRVNDIIMFHKISEGDTSMLLEKYAGSLFYVGFLKGDYEEKNGTIVPKANAVLTMFTERQVFKGKKIKDSTILWTRDYVYIGRKRGKVISHGKGELNIKI